MPTEWDFRTSLGELQGVASSPSPSSPLELDPEHEPDPSNSLYSKNQ